MRHIFIINAAAGRQSQSGNIRKMLKQLEDFEYLVFDTEYEGHETELTERMCDIFDDETIRFYVCGGNGTLARVLSGIADPSKTQVAFLPMGSTCDILNCFKGKKSDFLNIRKLIEGKVIPLDYIKTNKNLISLHNISVGLEAEIANRVRRMPLLFAISKKLAFKAAQFSVKMKRRTYNLRIRVDDEVVIGQYAWASVANTMYCNGRYYPYLCTTPTDGTLKVLLVENMSYKQFLTIRRKMRKDKNCAFGKLEGKIHCMEAEKIEMEYMDENEVLIEYDGEIFQDKKIEIQLIKNGLNFVVPRTVDLKEDY